MTESLTQRLQRAVALRDAETSKPVGYALSNPDGSPNLNAIYHRRENAALYSQAQHAHGGFGPIIPLYDHPDAAPSIVQLAVELGAECERLRAVLSGAAIACMEERVNAASTGEDSDHAYNRACEDCHDAILRMLKETPNAQ